MRIPIKPSGRRALPFYWWRRYRSHKYLSNKSSLIDKIINGDFEYSEFFKQAEFELHWMRDEQDEFKDNYKGREPHKDPLYLAIEIRTIKRYNKLLEDGMKEEFDRTVKLVNGLVKKFKIDKESVKSIMAEFDGTTEKLYYYIAQVQGMNINTLKFLNN